MSIDTNISRGDSELKSTLKKNLFGISFLISKKIPSRWTDKIAAGPESC